ncbi:hypothetical protein BDR22DRAFT_66762 [Usnea florida]
MDRLGINTGLVPLILIVRQLFEEVRKISTSSQDLVSGIEEQGDKFAVQQAIFESGSMLLLYLAAGSRENVEDMYEDMEHPMWKHEKLNRDLEERMAQFRIPCLYTLRCMEKNLVDCRAHFQKRGRKRGKRKDRFLRPRLSLKLPVSDPAEHFKSFLEVLRDCNDMICTYGRQIVQNGPTHLLRPSLLYAGEDTGSYQTTRFAQTSEGHFLCYQRASQNLYKSLSGLLSCHEASLHRLTIALDFNDSKFGGPVSRDSIRFRLSLGTPTSSRTFQLAVEFPRSTSCSCPGADGSLSCNLPLSKSGLADSELKKTTTDTLDLSEDAPTYGIEPPSFIAEACLYFEQKDNDSLDRERMCYMLEHLSCTLGGTSMTFLESYGPLLIFKLGLQGQPSNSLDDVLMQAKRLSLAISQEDRLRMAVSLATGMLCLHSTLWMPQRWGSKDIMISENHQSKDAIRLKDPFLRAHLENSTIDYPVPKRISSTAVNSPLYYLGIVLLELAFSAPLRELQVHEGFTRGLVKQEKDDLTVRRLSETVSRELGSRYAKVVRTCFPQIFRPQDLYAPRKSELDYILANEVVEELKQSLRAASSVDKVTDSESFSNH